MTIEDSGHRSDSREEDMDVSLPHNSTPAIHAAGNKEEGGNIHKNNYSKWPTLPYHPINAVRLYCATYPTMSILNTYSNSFNRITMRWFNFTSLIGIRAMHMLDLNSWRMPRGYGRGAAREGEVWMGLHGGLN